MSRRHVSRLDSRRWARIRLQVLDRDRWRCVKCGKAGRLEVDHIVSISRGGDPWNPANLQALCRSCHLAKSCGEWTRPEHPELAEWRRFLQG